MAATDATFTNTGGGSSILANSGGQLNASNSTFALSNLNLNAGSNAQLAANSFANKFSINSGATINIAGNNFTNSQHSGKARRLRRFHRTINLNNNYWNPRTRR